MLWLQDDRWIGPLSMTPRDDARWVVKEGENLLRVPVRTPPVNGSFRTNVGEAIEILQPSLELGHEIGICNWETNIQLAKRVLARIRKLDQKAFEHLQVTYKAFDSYIDLAASSGLIGTALEEELGRADRIRSLRTTIDENREVLEAAIEAFLESPTFQRDLEIERKRIFDRILGEQKLVVEAALSDDRREVDEVRTELAKERTKLDVLKAKIVEKNQELSDTISGYEGELRRRLQEVASSPESLFAEIAFIREAVGEAEQAPARMVPRPCTKSAGLTTPSPILDSEDKVVTALGRKLLASKLAPSLSKHLHSAITAGAVPLLRGPLAYDVARQYAEAVCGERLLWIPVSGTVYEPNDLLGHAAPNGRDYVPHPAGLLDLLLEAKESDELHLESSSTGSQGQQQTTTFSLSWHAKPTLSQAAPLAGSLWRRLAHL